MHCVNAVQLNLHIQFTQKTFEYFAEFYSVSSIVTFVVCVRVCGGGGRDV